ncbi:MAG: 30S ribosomal protein S3 [Planctomycetes bacterium]|nr:30S ribosomal protein S3 [Planctomycetota bacterium]
MGQKVNPTGFRTGITIGWKSRWFAPKSNFGEFLVEDEMIRRFIDQRLNRQPPYAAVSSVEIDRTREEVKVSLRTARPGLVIGPKGAEVEKLKEAIEDLTDRRVNISIIEIRNPDLEANLVAEGIAEQIKRRASFRRVIKQRADACMQAGAKGVKITVGGRLGGAEIARSETQVRGSVPLHTLEADVDYGLAVAVTTYGCVGIKVWIFRGMFGEEEEVSDSQQAAMTRARRRYQQRDGDGPGGPGGAGGGRPPRSGGPRRERTSSAPAASDAADQSAPTPPPAVPEPQAPKGDAGSDTPKDSTE